MDVITDVDRPGPQIAVDTAFTSGTVTFDVAIAASERGWRNQLTVAWGDGASESVDAYDGSTTRLSHTYAAHGTYHPTITATSVLGPVTTWYSPAITYAPDVNAAPILRSADATDGILAGPAPFNASVTLDATDELPTSLTYTANWGDGTGEQTGTWQPGQPVVHTYATPGTYTTSFHLTDPEGLTSGTQTVQLTAYQAEDLHADGGSDTTVFMNEPVRFNATNSRPWAGIKSLHWDFADGTTSTASDIPHTYANAGVYKATLTITSYSGETNTATRTITVKDPDATPGLHVRVTASGSAIQGANLSIPRPDGSAATAVTDASGKAILPVPADGQYAVHVQASGYVLATGTATVTDGTGQVSISLSKGASAPSVLSIDTITADQAKALGVDLSAASNQQIFKADILVTFAGLTRTISIVGTPGKPAVCVANCSAFAGGTSTGSGSGGDGPVIGQPTIVLVGDQPMIQWMKLSVTGSFLKEMFTVDMTLQNATADYAFTPGTATLNLPSGMSLADLADGSAALTHDVPSIPAGGSVTTSWVVRGDTAGTYTLSADYATTSDPANFPVASHAQTTPVKIWGLDGVSLTARVDSRVAAGSPYDIVETLTNKSGRTLYNVTLDGHSGQLESAGMKWIYSPTAARNVTAASLAPGRVLTRVLTLYPVNPSESRQPPVMEAISASVGAANLSATVTVEQNRSHDYLSELIAVSKEAGSVKRVSWLAPKDYAYATDASVHPVGYDIYTAAQLDGVWEKAGTTTDTTFNLDSSSSAAKFVTVTTVLSNGKRVNQHSIASLQAPPHAVTGLKVSTDGLYNAVRVSWDKGDFTDFTESYLVSTQAPGGAATAEDVTVAGSHEAVISGLSAGRAYTFSVTARNAMGQTEPALSEPILVMGVNGATPEWWKSDYSYTYGGGVTGNTTPTTQQSKILGAKISTLTGDMYIPAASPFTTTDLSAGSMTWSRAYSSASAGNSSPLGSGWTNKYLSILEATAADGQQKAVVTLGNGARVTFYFNPDTQAWATAPFLSALTLSRDATGWHFTTAAGERYDYNPDGRLLTISNAAGTVMQNLSYDAAGHLTTVTYGKTAKLTLSWAGERIVSAQYGTGVATYAYDAAGNLTSATTSAARTFTFTYDDAHHVTRYTIPATSTTAEKSVAFTYDQTGRVASQDPDGTTVTSLRYLAAEEGVNITRVTAGATPTITDYKYTSGLLLDAAVIRSGNRLENPSVTVGDASSANQVTYKTGRAYLLSWEQLDNVGSSYSVQPYVVNANGSKTKLGTAFPVAASALTLDEKSGLYRATNVEVPLVSPASYKDPSTGVTTQQPILTVEFTINATVAGKLVALAASATDKLALRTTVYPAESGVFYTGTLSNAMAQSTKDFVPCRPTVVITAKGWDESVKAFAGHGWRMGTLVSSLADSSSLGRTNVATFTMPSGHGTQGMTERLLQTEQVARWVVQDLRSLAEDPACDNSQFILAGDNEGAVVMKKAFADLPDTFLDARGRVKTVFLESDPTTSPDRNWISTFDPLSGETGVTRGPGSYAIGSAVDEYTIPALAGGGLGVLAKRTWTAAADWFYNHQNEEQVNGVADYEQSRFVASCIDGDSSCDPLSLNLPAAQAQLHASMSYLAKPGDLTTSQLLANYASPLPAAVKAHYDAQRAQTAEYQQKLNANGVATVAEFWAKDTITGVNTGIGLTSVYAPPGDGSINQDLKADLQSEVAAMEACGIGDNAAAALASRDVEAQKGSLQAAIREAETALDKARQANDAVDGTRLPADEDALLAAEKAVEQLKSSYEDLLVSMDSAKTMDAHVLAWEHRWDVMRKIESARVALEGAGRLSDALMLVDLAVDFNGCKAMLEAVKTSASSTVVGAAAVIAFDLISLYTDSESAKQINSAFDAMAQNKCFWTEEGGVGDDGTLNPGQWILLKSTEENDPTAHTVVILRCPVKR